MLQKPLRLAVPFRRELVEIGNAQMVAVPGLQVAPRRTLHLLADHGADLGLDAADDGLGDLVLDLENVFQVPVVSFGP